MRSMPGMASLRPGSRSFIVGASWDGRADRGGFQNGDMPAAAAAFSIGTANPIPMNTPCSLGFRMAVTMPTTSPSIVASGPPELPGFAAASNWIRLVNRRLPSRERCSRLSPDTTRADAERKSDDEHVVAHGQIARRAQRRRCQVIGDLLGLQDREVVLRLQADHVGVRFG